MGKASKQYRSLTTDVQTVPHPPRGDATGEIADALDRKMPKTPSRKWPPRAGSSWPAWRRAKQQQVSREDAKNRPMARNRVDDHRE